MSNSRPFGPLQGGWLPGGLHDQDYTAWQWQPTLSAHDPNPPITLETAGGGTASVVDAGGIASAEAFGADTFVDRIAVVDAGGIASGQAFGADTFVDHARIVDAGGIVSAQALGQPTLTERAAVV